MRSLSLMLLASALLFIACENSATDSDTKESYTLLVHDSGSGVTSLTPEKSSYDEGDTATLLAVADSGYHFTRWSGDTVSTTNPLRLVMSKDYTITALYEHDSIPVDTSKTPLQQLIAMGVDSADAAYLIANHSADVSVVLADQDRIFKNMPSLSTMFASPTNPLAPSFNDPQITTWTEEQKQKFTKMFGRFVFVINSPKFISSFNTHITLLNPLYQGAAPAIPYPKSYAEFRAAAHKALEDGKYQHTFFISQSTTWTAWGMTGLALKIEEVMLGTPAPGAPHNTEALILHEITHTWGYAHSGPDANAYTLKPNNIPYYVQFIVGTDADDPSGPMVWDTPKALLSVYFGNN